MQLVLVRTAQLVALVTATVLVAPGSSSAQPGSDLDLADQEVAQAAAVLEHATEQARKAANRYAEANAALPEAEARVDETRGVVVAAQVSARTAKREEQLARRQLAAASQRFDRAGNAVAGARDQAAGFAAAAYKGSGIAAFNLLLQARGPDELVDRLGYVEHIATAQREALDGLASARLDARQAENEATEAHEQAERARQAAQAALAEAEAAVAAAKAAAAEVETLVETRADALAAAEAEREESLQRYEQAEAEAARLAAEVRAWQQAQGSSRSAAGGSGGTVLARPTQGWMSSGYGMRFDPFFSVWQLHAGVDIAAAGGAPVYAAAGGTVIRAGWNGGYGNFTCLDHGSHDGQGLSTCYAHQSEIVVSDGQWVESGELIGRVGTTGASTGTHLHFEVRLDGETTDPVPFLPGF